MNTFPIGSRLGWWFWQLSGCLERQFPPAVAYTCTHTQTYSVIPRWSSHVSAQLPWAVCPDLDVASFGDKRVDVIPQWATRAEHYRSPLTFNFTREHIFKGPGLHIYLLNSSSVLHLLSLRERWATLSHQDGMMCRNGSGRVVLYFRDRVLRFALIKISFMFPKTSVSPSSFFIIGQCGNWAIIIQWLSQGEAAYICFMLNFSLYAWAGVGSCAVYQMNALAYCPFNYFCPWKLA